MSFSGRWCKFDDDRVTEFNAKALGRECFGGVSYEYERRANALLVFYERVQQVGSTSSELSAEDLKLQDKLEEQMGQGEGEVWSANEAFVRAQPV